MTVPRNFYDEVGGAPVFHKIIARFYEEVAADPVLRPLYPEEDLGPAEERLRMFLEQYWGGPRTYSDQRGHPRLRMRHVAVPDRPDRARRLAALHADRRGRGRAGRRPTGTSCGSTSSTPRPAWSTRRSTDPRTARASERPWQDAPVQWWRDAVFYQVYVPSFTDSDGDGIGDLQGIRSRLGYLELLGVDALWLSPIYPSPMVDNGYDITDHRGVDPVWGDLDAVDDLIADAHAHGIRVTVDLVPNHTSDQHPWFRAALASPTGSPERARYHFRPGQGSDGAEPPNGWRSVFGGSAWTREPAGDAGPGEWYLHLFSPAQPDLNWTNLEVWADLDKTLRFWLDRGVDGFRIDVAHGMCKKLDDAGRARRRRRRPAVRPGRRARRAPDDPRDTRPLPGAGGHRRARGAQRRPVRALRAVGRAAPGGRHPAGREPVRRGRGARRDRGLPGGGGLRGGRGVVVAVRPRPVPPRVPVRHGPGRAGAGAGDGPGAARAARRGVHLQRRRAGAARRRPARRGAPRRRLAPRRRRPRRLPRPAALGGGPACVRVHHRRAVAADPRGATPP